MKIIGLSGTNGSGKDTVAKFLSEKHGFLFVSGGDILREEVARRGLPIERENTRAVSTEWRKEKGLAVLIDKAVEKLKRTEKENLVIASLRNPGETDKVHELGGIVIWVDADPKIRYERIFSRQRSTDDKKTLNQFLREEKDEMHENGSGKEGLNMAAVKKKSDIFIENNGDMEEFQKAIQDSLHEYL